MAPSTPSKGADPRPGPLRSTQSFPHPENQEAPGLTTRQHRASTVQNGTAPEIKVVPTTPQRKQHGTRETSSDAFASSERDESPEERPRASVDLDDLPIELVSMTDNFIDSLSARVHATPPNIDRLSKLFQDFYATAAHHIQTHIDSLALRQNRPRPQPQSRASSAASLLRAKATSLGTKEKAKEQENEQQMLTAEELADRKRQRKAIELQKVQLEEAAERRLCEGIYDRIYRHRTTQDEAQDDKLRSKTAALALVGIGPADLGVHLGEMPEDDPEAVAKKQQEIHEYLDKARKDLMVMHEKRYPLGKLNWLKAAHKSIVETLAHFHPSSSADEIMPMLIYTLITMPPEKLNVISDMNFINRFRWEEKIEGEAAYCLTNLEAAITFLETVDLASLRENETLAGPSKSEGSVGTPKAETFPPAYTPGLSTILQSPTEDSAANAQAGKPPLSPTTAKSIAQRRRLSDLIQTPALAIGSARDSFFDTADQSFKNISNSLGDSYKFFLGKIRDTSASGKQVVVPRTLEDARKLIGTPPPEDDISLDGSTSAMGLDENERQGLSAEDRVLSLVGGKRAQRDHSADSNRSARSASSSKKVVFADDGKEKGTTSGSSTPAVAAANPALVDQMRNLGSSLNPLNRFSAAASMMPRFGRTTPAAATPPPPKDATAKSVDGGDLATAFPDIAASLPPKDIPQIKPPIKRFVEMQNPGELKLGEVLELLRDYRRLAGALKDMGAFKE